MENKKNESKKNIIFYPYYGKGAFSGALLFLFFIKYKENERFRQKTIEIFKIILTLFACNLTFIFISNNTTNNTIDYLYFPVVMLLLILIVKDKKSFLKRFFMVLLAFLILFIIVFITLVANNKI